MKNSMKTHRTFISALLAIVTFACISCSPKQKPENVAEEFLNAYFSADYEGAAKFCTPELGKDLMDALQQAQALEESVRANIQKYTQFYKPQIIKSEQPEKTDSVTVNYIVINTAADSLSQNRQVKESRVHIVKTQEGWKVSSLK